MPRGFMLLNFAHVTEKLEKIIALETVGWDDLNTKFSSLSVCVYVYIHVYYPLSDEQIVWCKSIPPPKNPINYCVEDSTERWEFRECLRHRGHVFESIKEAAGTTKKL